jgi:hypothetical protein
MEVFDVDDFVLRVPWCVERFFVSNKRLASTHHCAFSIRSELIHGHLEPYIFQAVGLHVLNGQADKLHLGVNIEPV